MIGESDEIFCAGAFVELHQFFGVPVFGVPEVVDVLETEDGRMAVMGDLIAIVGIALDIHISGIPVALFGDALSGPVGPDSKLGVSIPVGGLILGEGLPVGGEFSFGDRKHGGGLGGGDVIGVRDGGEQDCGECGDEGGGRAVGN